MDEKETLLNILKNTLDLLDYCNDKSTTKDELLYFANIAKGNIQFLIDFFEANDNYA